MLQFELVSPERLLMSAEATMVSVPGSEGDFGVLEGHAPMISTLRPGVVSVQGGPQDGKRIFVRGGFADVTGTTMTLLAEEAIYMDDLDAAALDQQIKNAQEDVTDAKDGEAKSEAQRMLHHLMQLRDAL